MRLRGNEDRGGEEGELITPHLLITHAARDRQTTANQSITIFHRRDAAELRRPTHTKRHFPIQYGRHIAPQPANKAPLPSEMDVFFLINPFSFRLKGKSGC